jgi:hypothetical protein
MPEQARAWAPLGLDGSSPMFSGHLNQYCVHGNVCRRRGRAQLQKPSAHGGQDHIAIRGDFFVPCSARCGCGTVTPTDRPMIAGGRPAHHKAVGDGRKQAQRRPTAVGRQRPRSAGRGGPQAVFPPEPADFQGIGGNTRSRRHDRPEQGRQVGVYRSKGRPLVQAPRAVSVRGVWKKTPWRKRQNPSSKRHSAAAATPRAQTEGALVGGQRMWCGGRGGANPPAAKHTRVRHAAVKSAPAHNVRKGGRAVRPPTAGSDGGGLRGSPRVCRGARTGHLCAVPRQPAACAPIKALALRRLLRAARARAWGCALQWQSSP